MISKTSSKQWLIIAMLLLGLMSIESLAIHYGYALENPGTADFFARWYGAKELVLHGRNPYHHDIELEAQEILFGRHTRSDEDQVNFAYPLYTIFIFLPLTLLSYAWAQAIWMTVLQFAMLGSALVLFDVIRWHPPIWLRISTLLWTIVFYSGTRAIMLGQFSVIVALCVFISIWGIMHGKDYLAGAILPLATIKPQMVFLLIPFFILWTFRQKRWNFLISFTVSTAVLMIASLIWLPDWLFSFLGNLSAYSGYVGFGSPLENMTAYFFPTIDVFLNQSCHSLLELIFDIQTLGTSSMAHCQYSDIQLNRFMDTFPNNH
ncbi:MAG: hypothetical protein B6242_00990 [Anaerolineaceae bacterium 4572_78]|nr:MAG: hypothetical protein B6242_00990 [Anaerolineaceae bacterium 4572_78]